MNSLKIIGGVGISLLAYSLLKSKKGTTVKNPRTDQSQPLTQFLPIVQPLEMRNDPLGEGHFGASRGIRTHNGVDLVTFEGQKIFSPIDGVVVRYANPYPDDSRWKGILIQGNGFFADTTVKIFYMNSMFFPSELIVAGQTIGISQAISQKHGSAMIDHIHVEVRQKGQLIDPYNLIFQTA
ncbi:MAG: M23 family metallopeptidase [Bacteroidota bacterium]